MGSALSTSGLVAFSTVLLVVMAILIVIVINRLNSITGNTTNTNLSSAHTKLVWAQVLAWIAAGLGLLLFLGYVTLHFLETSEWLHLILWVLLFSALIASIILLTMVLSDIDGANVSDNKGTTGYIWGAVIVGIVAFVILLISGGWRIAHKQSENAEPDSQYYMSANDMVPPSSSAEYPSQNQPQIQVTTSGDVAAPI